ncbi:MAG TPA: glutamate--tRNA ligase [Minicystis sp.]|nr:glutamate--tRNA ligase [Minicystis sp.]
MASPAGAPRLRFAPSPTGYLHIGGVRTALFNFLWAKKTGGTFILRIEDTDRERSTPENEAVILRDLRWLGLLWDEGPEVGGAYGPYKQMDRLAVYQEFADKLIERGAAYRCFCTKEELDAQRAALKAKDPKAEFRYPGTCRDRTPPYPDRPSVLRLKAPSAGAVTYDDLVFGEVTTPNATQQDAVLMRSDGVPLYNLGAVVDDVTMGVTLVARGRDHMINTPIQILLYRALGFEPPRFAHLPMMLAPDGQKLSKRHGAVSVGEYRERGIPPAALLNYLVRFGWSFGDEEIFTLGDLVEKFSWDRCGTSDGKFDAKKLAAIAFEHMKRPELTALDAYVAGVTPYLEARGIRGVDRKKLELAIATVRERAQTFVDAAAAMDFYFRDPPELDEKAAKKFLVAANAPRLRAVRDVLAGAPAFTANELEAAVAGYLERAGLALKDVAQPARVALTGRTASPGIYEVLEVLGRDLALARLDRAAALAEGQPG